jgi:hypothetical protein
MSWPPVSTMKSNGLPARVAVTMIWPSSAIGTVVGAASVVSAGGVPGANTASPTRAAVQRSTVTTSGAPPPVSPDSMRNGSCTPATSR